MVSTLAAQSSGFSGILHVVPLLRWVFSGVLSHFKYIQYIQGKLKNPKISISITVNGCLSISPACTKVEAQSQLG